MSKRSAAVAFGLSHLGLVLSSAAVNSELVLYTGFPAVPAAAWILDTFEPRFWEYPLSYPGARLGVILTTFLLNFLIYAALGWKAADWRYRARHARPSSEKPAT